MKATQATPRRLAVAPGTSGARFPIASCPCRPLRARERDEQWHASPRHRAPSVCCTHPRRAGPAGSRRVCEDGRSCYGAGFGQGGWHAVLVVPPQLGNVTQNDPDPVYLVQSLLRRQRAQTEPSLAAQTLAPREVTEQ